MYLANVGTCQGIGYVNVFADHITPVAADVGRVVALACTARDVAEESAVGEVGRLVCPSAEAAYARSRSRFQRVDVASVDAVVDVLACANHAEEAAGGVVAVAVGIDSDVGVDVAHC